MLNEEHSDEQTIPANVDGRPLRRGRPRRRNALIPHSRTALLIYQFAQKESLRRRGLLRDDDEGEETCPTDYSSRGYGAPCA